MADIRSIWETLKTDEEIIIKTRIDSIPYPTCYAAKNCITGNHIYLMHISKDTLIPELKNYRFKGVEIFSVELADVTEFNIHLLDNDLGDIFTLFIQNIIDDIIEVTSEAAAVTRTLGVISRWKRLFDKLSFNGLNIEQQKGLMGELYLINKLLDCHISPSRILSAWTGAEYKDKDFIFDLTGIEVKLTSSKKPRINISNERQLNTKNLSDLYLYLLATEETKKDGFTLNSLIAQIRQKISVNPEDLDNFNETLILLGYFDDDAQYYNTMYSFREEYCFNISHEFPKIDSNNLSIGIYDVSYCIEISAALNFSVEFVDIIEKI